MQEQREQKSGFGLRLAGSGSRELPGRFSRQRVPALMGNWLWACLNRCSAAARPPRAGTLRSGSALGPRGEHGGRRGKAPSATGIGVSRASPGPARGRLVLAAAVPLMMMIPLQMNLSYFHATKFPGELHGEGAAPGDAPRAPEPSSGQLFPPPTRPCLSATLLVLARTGNPRVHPQTVRMAGRAPRCSPRCTPTRLKG